MRSFIKAPRVYVPCKDYNRWAVCDTDLEFGHEFWERVAASVGDAPSAFSFVVPSELREECSEAEIHSLHEKMYSALTQGWIERIERGVIFTTTEMPSYTRHGVLLAIDLEEIALSGTAEGAVRFLQKPSREHLPLLKKIREGSLLEFPQTIIACPEFSYKGMKAFFQGRPERLYEYKRGFSGRTYGDFYVGDAAHEVAHAIEKLAKPCLFVASGEQSLLAAKEYWEDIKGKLTREEYANHPARYSLAEFASVDEVLPCLLPLHRVVCDVNREEFISYITSQAAFTDNEGVLCYNGAWEQAASNVDGLIAEFLRAAGGSVCYVDEKEIPYFKDHVIIRMPHIEGKGIANFLKQGGILPVQTFMIDRQMAKYHFEGREISYD